MKKFLSKFLMVLVAAFVMIAANVTLTSCDKGKAMFTPTVESAQVKLCIDSIVNPAFTSATDAISLQNTLNANAYVDSIFMNLPEKTVRDVCSVLLKRRATVTKKDIVNEFVANRQIYENLPKNGAPTADKPDVNKQSETIAKIGPVELTNEATTTVKEAPPTRVGYSGSYKDTTINGKKAIIQTE